jgi:hypothetical protein
LKGLTKNGQHDVEESEGEAFKRFLLLIAEDQETIAETILTTPPEMVATALQETAAVLRRKLQSVTID